MEWYQGGIAEAVTESRKNGSIFVVYIEGKDDKSKQVTETINTPQISKMLSSRNFVAIHVEYNSVTHQQFSEIYKQTTAPSIYFIGKTGAPLEIITDAELTSADMVQKINQILVKNGGKPMEPMQLEEMVDDIKEVPVTPVPQADTALTPDPTPVPVVASTLKPAEPAPDQAVEIAASSSPEQITIDEKLVLAQELIAKKRKDKELEEKEKERNKEIERRKLGQDMQNMKRWQQDQEIKNMMDERQKERRADQEARERVKRQIEEDKREKAARMNNVVPVQQPEPLRVSARAVNSDTARLQFRLPDGSQITHDFKSSACLQEVMDYLQLHENQRDFILSTTFPKREFTINDGSQSLMDLQLVPNAAMLVLPSARRAVSTNNSSGGFSGMVWYILAPIFSFLEYLKSFVWGAPPRPPPTSSNDNKRPNTDPEPSGSGSVKKRISGESKVKKQGNVHRLHEHDSDEDNNTWNGNSTQQM